MEAESTATKNNHPLFSIGFLGALVGVAYLALAHEAHAAVESIRAWTGLPQVPGITSLTLESVSAQIQALQDAQDVAQADYDLLVRIAPANDPDLAVLKHTITYYDTMHDKLVALKPQVGHLQNDVLPNQQYSQYHKLISTSKVQGHIDAIKTVGGLGISSADEAQVRTAFNRVDAFFHTARPGTVLYTDTEGTFGPKGARFWYPLSGDHAHGLPPLVHFKADTLDKLPLSTARAVYELQLNLKDQLTLQTVLGELEGANAKASVTEGWPVLYDGHAPHGGHADGSAVDFAVRDSSPQGVAKVLAAGADLEKTRGTHMWFEIPGSKDSPADAKQLATFRAGVVQELQHLGYSHDAAVRYTEQHSRLVGKATGVHFHFDTPRPPVYAPDSLMAAK